MARPRTAGRQGEFLCSLERTRRQPSQIPGCELITAPILALSQELGSLLPTAQDIVHSLPWGTLRDYVS